MAQSKRAHDEVSGATAPAPNATRAKISNEENTTSGNTAVASPNAPEKAGCRASRGGAAHPDQARALWSGWWKLDTTVSDTMQKYLSALGLSMTAIAAALKTEVEFSSFQCFKIEENFATVRRKSRLSRTVDSVMGQKHRLGQTESKDMRSGTQTSRAEFNFVPALGGSLVITHERPLNGGTAIIINKREIIETPPGCPMAAPEATGALEACRLAREEGKEPPVDLSLPPLSIKQTLTVTVPGKDDAVTTVRYWRRNFEKEEAVPTAADIACKLVR
jgi:hypothetical protein